MIRTRIRRGCGVTVADRLSGSIASDPPVLPVMWLDTGFFGKSTRAMVVMDFDPWIRIDRLHGLDDLERFWKQNRAFSCGWISYDAGLAMAGLSGDHGMGQQPVAWWGVPNTRVVETDEGLIIETRDARSLTEVRDWLHTSPIQEWSSAKGSWMEPDFHSEEDYIACIEQVLGCIAAGECYQVNITERRRFRWSHHPGLLMKRFVDSQPAAWSAYWSDGNRSLLCGSPELGVRVENGWIEARPMKGTRPRGTHLDQNRKAAVELYESPKERAENLMVVDMWRNDLAQVCHPGSVVASPLFKVEPYRTVYQMVSVVRGRLDETKTAWDWLRSTLPSSSVTGAPKRRAMQWIKRLERSNRGIYCGMIGWLALNGSACWNVAIRTAWLEGKEGVYGVGGGIVADSIPAMEWKELQWKTEAFDRALFGGPVSQK